MREGRWLARLGAMCMATGMVCGPGCKNDMYDQPSVQSHEVAPSLPSASLPVTGREELAQAEAIYSKLVNPVPVEEASARAGNHLFQIYCSPCHGPEGKGDGPLAAHFGLPPDLGEASYLAQPDGFFYAMIRHGTGLSMPGYGDSLSPQERWHIVNFLRTLQKR